MVAPAFNLLSQLFQHYAPDQTFGVEFEDLRNLDDQVLELDIDYLLVDSDEDIDQFLVTDKEADD